MLIRHIVGRRASGRRLAHAGAAHAGDLARYILNPSPRAALAAGGGDAIGHRQGRDERVVYTGSRNFVFETTQAQIHELETLCHDAIRARRPTEHYVLAWSPGEQPSDHQVDEAVDLLVDGLGYQGLRVLFARHADRHHDHAHVLVCRWDEAAGKMRKRGAGLDYIELQKIGATIAHRQGWSLPDRTLFKVDPATGQLVDQRRPQRQTQSVSARAAAVEQNSGEISIQRLAQEQARPIIEGASSWSDLHRQLAAAAWTYTLHRGGAVLTYRGVRVKASSAARSASLAALEKRFGPFAPAPSDIAVAPAARPPLEGGADSGRIAEYQAARRRRNQAARAARAEMRRRHDENRRKLLAEYREQRQAAQLFGMPLGHWRGRRAEMNALASQLAHEHAIARAELRDRQRRERAAYAAQFPPWPIMADWLTLDGDLAAAAEHRYRRTLARRRRAEQEAAEAATLSGDTRGNFPRLPPSDIRDFVSKIEEEEVTYRRATGQQVAFIDRGDAIVVKLHDEATVLAALQLAAAKWQGQVRVDGPDAFRRLAVRLAARNGIRIKNKELQAEYAAERAKYLEELTDIDPATPAQPQTMAASIENGHLHSGDPISDRLFRHIEHVLKTTAAPIDKSRVLLLAAARLSQTGHTAEQVRVAVAAVAPVLHEREERDWQRYAARTTAAAFSPAARTAVESLALAELMQLEHRIAAPMPDPSPIVSAMTTAPPAHSSPVQPIHEPPPPPAPTPGATAEARVWHLFAVRDELTRYLSPVARDTVPSLQVDEGGVDPRIVACLRQLSDPEIEHRMRHAINAADRRAQAQQPTTERGREAMDALEIGRRLLIHEFCRRRGQSAGDIGQGPRPLLSEFGRHCEAATMRSIALSTTTPTPARDRGRDR